MTTVTHPALLSTLLPTTPWLLVFCLPLLFASLLSLPGAFLTLDRTRTFPPTYDAIPGGFDVRSKKKFTFILEGGVGGLAAGYAFGVHLTTGLALLIPSLTSSPQLSPKAFLPLWLLSAIAMTFVAGRWQLAALIFSGITGGTTLALAFAVIVHPGLLVRQIFLALLAPPLVILVLVPPTRRLALRTAAASTGAFGTVLVIALLAHEAAWAEVWERFWVSFSVSAAVRWATPGEKGLSAAYCFLLAGGCAADWALRRRFGENPDQKWDSYLATYSRDLPNASDRAGSFQPLKSWWQRLFEPTAKSSSAAAAAALSLHGEKDSPEAGLIYPPDADLKLPPPSSGPIKLHKMRSASTVGAAFTPPPEYLRKPSRARGPRPAARRRSAVKFGDTDGSSSSDDDLDVLKTPPGGGLRPRLESGSSATLHDADGVLDVDKELARAARAARAKSAVLEDVPEYSDGEGVDVTAQARAGEPWEPGFIRRHRSSAASERTAVNPPSAAPSKTVAKGEKGPPGAVPMTPSLIRAFDRISQAQLAAYPFPPVALGRDKAVSLPAATPAGGDGGKPVRPGLPASKSSAPGVNEGMPKPPRERADRAIRWDEFWGEVKEKARGS